MIHNVNDGGQDADAVAFDVCHVAPQVGDNRGQPAELGSARGHPLSMIADAAKTIDESLQATPRLIWLIILITSGLRWVVFPVLTLGLGSRRYIKDALERVSRVAWLLQCVRSDAN